MPNKDNSPFDPSKIFRSVSWVRISTRRLNIIQRHSVLALLRFSWLCKEKMLLLDFDPGNPFFDWLSCNAVSGISLRIHHFKPKSTFLAGK
jgi:hypothetical protein